MPVTRLQLRDRIYDRLENNRTLYSDAELNRAINNALRLINGVSGFWQRTLPLNNLAQDRVAIYTLPDSMFIPSAVYYETRPLNPTSVRELGLMHPTWRTDTTGSTGVNVRDWAPLSFRQFAIWPAPSKGGRVITVSGICLDTDLTADDATLPIGDTFIDLAEDWAFMWLVMKESGKPFADAVRQSSPRWRTKLEELRKWQSFRSPNFWIERAMDQ